MRFIFLIFFLLFTFQASAKHYTIGNRTIIIPDPANMIQADEKSKDVLKLTSIGPVINVWVTKEREKSGFVCLLSQFSSSDDKLYNRKEFAENINTFKKLINLDTKSMKPEHKALSSIILDEKDLFLYTDPDSFFDGGIRTIAFLNVNGKIIVLTCNSQPETRKEVKDTVIAFSTIVLKNNFPPEAGSESPDSKSAINIILTAVLKFLAFCLFMWLAYKFRDYIFKIRTKKKN